MNDRVSSWVTSVDIAPIPPLPIYRDGIKRLDREMQVFTEIQRSRDIIWSTLFNKFFNHFSRQILEVPVPPWTLNEIDFQTIQFIINMQGLLRLTSADGVLWFETLNAIVTSDEPFYKSFVSRLTLEEMTRITSYTRINNTTTHIETPSEREHRLQIEADMRFMRDNEVRWIDGRLYRPNGVPTTTSGARRSNYFWDNVGRNISGTFINERLSALVPQTISDMRNIITVQKWADGRAFLSFYVWGVLQVLTYVSPWTLQHRTPNFSRPFIKRSDGRNLDIRQYPENHPHGRPKRWWALDPQLINIDRYHISNVYPEESPWASMPYAVHISWWVRFHGSSSQIDWLWHSHGCIRVPLFYIKRMYDIIHSINMSPWSELVIDVQTLY